MATLIFIVLFVLAAGFFILSEGIVGRPNGTTDGREEDS